MIALQIAIDSAPPVLAGAGDLQVLALALGCNPQADLMNPSRVRRGVAPQPSFDLSVTGMVAGAAGQQSRHISWLEGVALRTGQTVTITVIETMQADPAMPSGVALPRGRGEREHFEHCKRVYLELKDQYDSSPTVPRQP